MFSKVSEPDFVRGEHEMLRFWEQHQIFDRLRAKNAPSPKTWSFLDGPITANNPMGVHHAWGRTYKDVFQRYFAMTGHRQRYQNGFDCQGLWVEVEVEKELKLGTKKAILDYGIDRFVNECKKRVLRFAARQTEQSIRLGYWMEWDDPEELRKLAEAVGTDETVSLTTPKGQKVEGKAHELVAKLGNPEWGGSYFTFSTENNETIWSFLKKCFERGKVYRGHDVMPWSGQAGSAYSQMEVADGRRLTTHRSCFIRLPIVGKERGARSEERGDQDVITDVPSDAELQEVPPSKDVYHTTEKPEPRHQTHTKSAESKAQPAPQRSSVPQPSTLNPQPSESLNPQPSEYLLVWTTTPWTLTSNVACAVNPDLDYVKLKSKRDGSVYYFAKDNLEYKRLDKEFKEGFGRPEWGWPQGVPKLKTIGQLFKEQGGFEVDGTLKGAEMIGWQYAGPFDDLPAQRQPGGFPSRPHGQSKLPWKYASPESSVDRAFWLLDSRLNADAEADLLENQIRDQIKSRVVQIDTKIKDLFESNLPNHEKPPLHGMLEDEKSRVIRSYQTLVIGYVVAAQARFLDAVRLVLRHGQIEGSFEADAASLLDFPVTEKFFQNLGLESVKHPLWSQIRAVQELSSHWMNHSLDLMNSRFGPLETWRILKEWQSVDVEDRQVKSGFVRELTSKQREFLEVLRTELNSLYSKSAVEFHHVIDGGRDFKGNPNVVAGEGTGIVHIAPGCGDIDHQIGQQLGLVEIAPLDEDGTFMEGFGDFTGRDSVDPATAQLVFDKLKEKHLLVYVEEYPHIYPHCWRTGVELVFRLVDEWFINMDWRDEIKAVVNQANWLPDSIDGKTRENEWLSNMRDWMVSKKRFWGLALPIWVNPNDPGDFEVMGSLAELKERAVEGWNDFSGQTPHRPWIDKVKIKSKKTGAVLSRIPDVGNPWLDAGIVPFSTLNYNERYPTDLLKWSDWYSPDFVTECFPGQFRNWFYSLLSLSTMMLYDDPERKDRPELKRPFKTLLGHRLVMNEEGKPMHKSDGTAIWFEEAAEQLGVDTMRWMYLAQNPAVDLRFGTRHRDKTVTLETTDGPVKQTREGVPTCLVTSKPSDEVRRQILIPLWNSYAFFVNYARLDGFDPGLPQVPVSERPEIDRWILSNLQALIRTARQSFEEFNTPAVCQAAATFIDDLSNWYIRRNRRRFWRSRAASGEVAKESGWDADKLAAYQTLYHVLLTLTKVLAPAIPFLSERMYQNLVGNDPVTDSQPSTNPQPSSVHLCHYPEVDAALLDESLNRRTSAAQLMVTLGHRLRETSGHRVRQPLAELRFACASLEQRHAIETLADVVGDELNVKKVTSRDNLDDLVHYAYKPNLKTLGPKLGKLLNLVKTKLPTVDPHQLSPLRRGEPVTLSLDGNEITLAPEDVMVSTEQATDWVAADDQGIQIALSTTLTPELVREGMARDFVRHVQQLRKDANLEIQDRIRVTFSAESPEVAAALREWGDYIRSETLAEALNPSPAPPAGARPVPVGEANIHLAIEKL